MSWEVIESEGDTVLLTDDDIARAEITIYRGLGVPWQFLFPHDPVWLELLVAEVRDELRGYYLERGIMLNDR